MPEDREPRQRRRASGSPVRQNAPSLLFILMLVNVAAFAVPRLSGGSISVTAGMLGLAGLRSGEWWTVVTHSFVHNDLLHLLTNMALLWVAGRRVLADMGPRHFLGLYFGSGLVASAVSLLLHPASPLMGASGCVAGVIAGYAALHPDRSVTARLGPFFPRLSARNFLRGLLLSEIILEGLSIATERTMNIPMLHGVAHAAHAAGLFAGWLYAWHLAPRLNFLHEREDFFPKGLRRRRMEVEARPVPAARGGHAGPAVHVPRAPARPPEKTDDEFLREAVDPVLDKLYAQGMNSLTPEERNILNEAANRFSRRGKS
ncbi:MAG: aarA [Verrucomicrobiales bacterium]|nr:aarA [Verrucomicrobiales bacterium]